MAGNPTLDAGRFLPPEGPLAGSQQACLTPACLTPACFLPPRPQCLLIAEPQDSRGPQTEPLAQGSLSTGQVSGSCPHYLCDVPSTGQMVAILTYVKDTAGTDEKLGNR